MDKQSSNIDMKKQKSKLSSVAATPNKKRASIEIKPLRTVARPPKLDLKTPKTHKVAKEPTTASTQQHKPISETFTPKRLNRVERNPTFGSSEDVSPPPPQAPQDLSPLQQKKVVIVRDTVTFGQKNPQQPSASQNNCRLDQIGRSADRYSQPLSPIPDTDRYRVDDDVVNFSNGGIIERSSLERNSQP